MVKRALVGGLLTAAVLVWVPAQGAERPLSEAIRAAADAVRPAVVTIEVKGRVIRFDYSIFRCIVPVYTRPSIRHQDLNICFWITVDLRQRLIHEGNIIPVAYMILICILPTIYQDCVVMRLTIKRDFGKEIKWSEATCR